MSGRPLNADEAALWARVVASVTPYRTPASASRAAPPPPPPPVRTARSAPPASPAVAPPVVTRPTVSNTLDGSWDRRLARGLAAPDAVIDLHGLSVDAAYRRIDMALEQAIAQGDRLLVLVTGKARADRASGGRGAIRAAVADWLAASRHSRSVAAVRGAAPRHGGAGALYVILRRARP